MNNLAQFHTEGSKKSFNQNGPSNHVSIKSILHNNQ